MNHKTNRRSLPRPVGSPDRTTPRDRARVQPCAPDNFDRRHARGGAVLHRRWRQHAAFTRGSDRGARASTKSSVQGHAQAPDHANAPDVRRTASSKLLFHRTGFLRRPRNRTGSLHRRPPTRQCTGYLPSPSSPHP